MKFLTADPWTKQFWEKYDDGEDDFVIPTSDEFAYAAFPTYQDLYNKINLCELQGLKAVPHGVKTSFSPCFSKPIYNLYGMSKGTRIIDDFDDMCYRPGHMLMEVLYGEELSTDFLVKNGKVLWHQSMMAYKNNGSFSCWATIKRDVPESVSDFIYDQLTHYTGPLMLETIKDKVIDLGLRVSDQFVDLYGSEWMSRYIEFEKNKEFELDFESQREGFSCVLRTAKPGIYQVDEAIVKQIKDWAKISSVQITLYPDTPVENTINDDSSYRLAIVNGWDYSTCMKAIELLKRSGFTYE